MASVHPGKRRKVSVTIPKRLRNQISREAKRLAPKECYAIMLGRVTASGHTIDWLYWPDIVGDHSTEDKVFVRHEWWHHAEQVARDNGLSVIGDVHSHCYDYDADDHAPSEPDWDRLDREYIQGICLVATTPSGKQRASLKFWAACPAVTMKVVA